MVKNKKAFTLVELLAVIVVLGLILLIAVPQVMNVINDSKKGVLASSARLIANSAENIKLSNDTMGISTELQCSDVSKISASDYEDCTIEFVNGEALVTIIGKGKYEGLSVCKATSEDAEVIEGKCTTPFEKDNWATIKAAVTLGDTSKYKVGDTRPIDLDIDGDGKDETYTLRIANNSHYVDKGECKDTNGNALASETACGFVIEFADIITNHNMNSTDTNAGGWPASTMRTYVNGDIYNALPAELRNAIIDTTVVSSLGSEDKNRAEGNFVSEDKLYLLSPEEVYGTSPGYDTSRGTTRQLDWYRDKGVTRSSYSNAIKKNSSNTAGWWWLRSAYSNNPDHFYTVDYDGRLSTNNASSSGGVSPAFRLG